MEMEPKQKKLHSLLDAYKESHLHPTNQKIHWICVPLIFYSIVGILHAIPLGQFSAAWLSLAMVWVYYYRLSLTLSLGFILVAALCLAAAHGIQYFGNEILIYSSLSIFILAWIGQFYGHRLEGKKPSFLTDVQFLLIGPAWILQFVYKRLGVKF